MRLTYNKLLAWLTEEFKKREIDFTPAKVERTYYNQSEYEGGAARLLITIVNNKLTPDSLFYTLHFNSYYSLKSLNNIPEGYEMYLKIPPDGILVKFEIDVRKKL